MSRRRPFVGGNWKMNMDLALGVELAEDVAAACGDVIERCDVGICPPFPYLQAVGKALGHHGIMLGAQDVYHESNGAFTGEVSTDMLLDLNVAAAIVGHSERRHVLGEDDELVNVKTQAALRAGLIVILCVGETLDERTGDRTEQVVVRQLASGLAGIELDDVRGLVVAYEPVWAIGTGRTSTPGDAQDVHRLLRSTLADLYDDSVADSVRIQYGGSVKPANAAELIAQPDIDGFLVGGASLKPDDFMAIIRSAANAA